VTFAMNFAFNEIQVLERRREQDWICKFADLWMHRKLKYLFTKVVSQVEKIQQQPDIFNP
jgi:hypothetical protein